MCVAGPLDAIRVIEIGSIGPGPFAAMMLADNGAEVIRIDRPEQPSDPSDVMLRSRKIITLDLKSPADIETLLTLVRSADALIEGFRPGTMERLGIGPDELLQQNPRLVIGRMTGWGQEGPYSSFAGHDINYISISGALHAIGPADLPVAPPALIGDFAGGGMILAFAVTAALLKARETGVGQIIDCAMCDGSAVLMSAFYSFHAQGKWHDRRSANVIDGGSHFYGVYRTADEKFVSIGAIEPKFYSLLLDRLGLNADPQFANQLDEGRWPELRRKLEGIFCTKTRDEWCALMEHTDICFAPVLGLVEAPEHPHLVARGSFVEVEGVLQPAPVPRYSVTPLGKPQRPRSLHVDDMVKQREYV
jgi:alpha-methylacyl-CoA racemase